MDYTAMDFWWKVALTLLNLGIGVYLFWERHNDGTKKRMSEFEEKTDGRLDDHSTKIAKMEAQLEILPSHDDLGDLHDRINLVTSGMDKVSGELIGIKTTLNLIHEYLLKGGSK